MIRTWGRVGVCVLGLGCGAASSERVDELEAQIAAQEAAIASLTALVADQGTSIDTLETDGSSLSGRVGNLETGATSSGDRLDDLEAIVDVLDIDAARIVDTAITIDVPGDVADLPAALASLSHVRFGPNGSAKIQIADGTYTFTQQISFWHPEGARISIVGNTATEGAVVLRFEGSNGIRVQDTTLGLIDGVTIESDSTVAANGLLANNGAIRATRVVVEGFTGIGIVSDFGSMIVATASRASGNGTGFQSSNGSTLVADDSAAIDNTSDGFVCSRGSYLRASRLEASGNRDGLSVFFGGTIHADDADIHDNDRRGISAAAGGFVNAPTSTLDANLLGIYAAVGSTVQFTSASVGASTGGTDVIATVGSFVYGADSALGVTSPELNTVGNDHSYIDAD